MRRFIAVAVTLLSLLSAVNFSAAGKELYSTYTPRSANSSLFYIDVFCETEISAAVFELQYDDSIVSYYSGVAVNDNASLRDYVQEGKVAVAFADSKPAGGQLCRLSFKALKTGEVRFVLHMVQAAGADKTKLPQMEDDSLTVRLGKDDVVTGGKTNRTLSVSSVNGEKSDLEDDDSLLHQGGIFDLRQGDSLKWLLIGAGLATLIVLLVLAGVLIGRRTLTEKPQNEQENPPPQEVTNGEE